MPRGDGTGPAGKGPRTGRGLGPCNPNISRPNKNINRPKRQKRNRGWPNGIGGK